MASADDNARGPRGISSIARRLSLWRDGADVRSSPVADVLARRTAGGGSRARRDAARRAHPLSRLRPSLPDPRGSRGRLPRPLPRGRRAPRARAATWARCSATRSRRSRSSTPCPAPTRSPSACSAAICTARYCQNWFTSQSIRDPEAVGRPRDVAPEELVGLAADCRRADDRLDLQRAAHHHRVGGRGLPRGEGARACAPATSPTATARREVLDYIRPVDRLLQGRPEVDGRQALPPARRRAAERARHDRRASTRGASGSRC